MGFKVGDRGYYMSHTGTFDTPPAIYPFTVLEIGRMRILVLLDGKTKPSYADTDFCYETM